jgi:hypothetical protein
VGGRGVERGGVEPAVESRRRKHESIAYHGRKCSGGFATGQERLRRVF